MKKRRSLLTNISSPERWINEFSDHLLSSLVELFTREFIRRAARCLTSRASVRILWSW